MEINEQIAKRVNLDSSNLKKLKILTTLLEDEVDGMNDKKKLDYVLNKAISSYYSSSEIKELLEL